MLKRRVELAFALVLVAIVMVGGVSYQSVILSSESNIWVQHTHEVLDSLHDLTVQMMTVDSAYRGFALTGAESNLASYNYSLKMAEQDRADLHALTSDNPTQQLQLPSLDGATAEQIAFADRVIGARRAGGLQAAADAVLTADGERITGNFRKVAGRLESQEVQLLAIRMANTQERLYQAKILSVVGIVSGLLITGLAGWKLRSDNARRSLAEEALRGSEEQYQTLLYEVQEYAVSILDLRGQIVTWNAGAERILGFRAEQIIGQNFSCFFLPEEIRRGAPEKILRMTAASGRYEEQGTRVRADGSQFMARVTFTAVRSRAGKLQGFTEISRDLSETKESVARYRGLLEAAPDAMVVVNQAGEIVLVNVQAEKRFGYRRDELLGQKVASIIPLGFAERLVADGLRSTEDALDQQIGSGIELTARRKDGSQFPIEIMLSPLESDDGVLVTAAIRDIGVRKRAEDHLVQMEGRYRGLLEAAPDAMVVVNQAGEIVLVNVQAEKRFGYRRDELLGKTVASIIPLGFAERLVADGLRSTEDALDQQIGSGIELTARRKDGSQFPIEIMLSPLESDEGVLVTAAIRDISVRKQAEDHLVQMEGRYRGLLEAAPDAMVVVNQAGAIVLVNVQAEKQFGYRRDELLGQKVANIIPLGFSERLVADALRSTEDALDQQIGTGIELTAQRRDGSQFPIEIMLSPLDGDEGILVTAAIRDISLRKSAGALLQQKIEELNRSNRELEQFAAIASHDLQEPLRMVASYTQLLARRYKGKLDPDADDFIAFAVDGASRMQRLIGDLLAYSRVGTKGKGLLEISSEHAFAQALVNLRGAVEDSGASVTHGPLPAVIADESQLIQLFQNLVGNAIKYQTSGAPEVHVSATMNAQRKWIFSVKDNGLGIEPQYFERIFGMFQRLHAREEFSGTGIGLAICKKIVERHGGDIMVTSKLGEGSTFSFGLMGSERAA